MSDRRVILKMVMSLDGFATSGLYDLLRRTTSRNSPMCRMPGTAS